MQRIENRMKPIHRFLAVVVLCGLFFSILPTAQGFFATTVKELSLLLKRIDKPQWRIGYNFTVDCPVEFRQKEAEMSERTTRTVFSTSISTYTRIILSVPVFSPTTSLASGMPAVVLSIR